MHFVRRCVFVVRTYSTVESFISRELVKYAHEVCAINLSLSVGNLRVILSVTKTNDVIIRVYYEKNFVTVNRFVRVIYIYIYIYICVCGWVGGWVWVKSFSFLYFLYINLWKIYFNNIYIYIS